MAEVMKSLGQDPSLAESVIREADTNGKTILRDLSHMDNVLESSRFLVFRIFVIIIYLVWI